MKIVHRLVFHFLLYWLLFSCYESATNGTNFKCIDHERQALLTFKQGITTDLCGLLTSWENQQDCCLWLGILCNNHTGNVIALHLHGANEFSICLKGKMDPSLFELKHLISLDLSNNVFFESSIPKSIDLLTNLEHLNFKSSRLGGEIPYQLGNLSKLVSLDLSDNNFHFVTSLDWLSRLTLLKEVDLGETNLSQVTNLVQIVNHLPRLSALHLGGCQLSQKSVSLSYINSSLNSLRNIDLSSNSFNDTSIFQWLFNLSRNGNNQIECIDLSLNSLGGPIPIEFGNMHSLLSLDLHGNLLEGSIPDSFSNLRSFKDLDLSSNKLQGSISKFLINLCDLENLVLSSNRFFDNLSNIIQALSSGCTNKSLLKKLDLRKNMLWGSIPDSITKFSSLRELFLDSNKLNGTISQGVGQLSTLETLHVHANLLEGIVNHTHFRNLSRLKDLIISNNRALVFNVSEDWIPPFQLGVIGLASCKLGPSFPKWLFTQINILDLDISNNNISDFIPNTFWTKLLTSNSSSINLSSNKFQGILPNLPTTFNSLWYIDLSSNYFESSIPSSFLGPYTTNLYLNDNLFSSSANILCPKTPTILHYLDLSNNLLSGELPDCWMKFEQLQSLHLENNIFSGIIPSSIGALTVLCYLHLESNNFSGELPKTLANCTYLVILDLRHNSLTGYIPSSIGGAFKALRILNLRGNNFYGRLPLSLCLLSHLRVLDLANNQFSGSIPNCIHNLRAMLNSSNVGETFCSHSMLGTSNNESAIIEWKSEEQKFGNSKRLVILIDLSCNKLRGKIPNGISSLTGLLSLNLSTNNLTGNIPSNIGRLMSLEVLDLSNNHLYGRIPKGLAKLTFLDNLYVTNNNLSGKIPYGTQLQSFNTSSYMGNPMLCGLPLPYCPGDEPPTKTPSGENQQEDQDNNEIYPGLYISAVLGFIVGFWGVCGTLVAKRSWRLTFFQFFHDI